MGFEAKINIIAKAKVEVGKFSTVSRNTNNNIEGFNINNSAAGLIALINLTTLSNLILLNRKIVVIAIYFLYFFISF